MAATLKKQKKNTKDEFEERAKAIIVEFAQQVGEFSEEPIRMFVSFVVYLVKSPFSLIQICSPMSWVFLLLLFSFWYFVVIAVSGMIQNSRVPDFPLLGLLYN